MRNIVFEAPYITGNDNVGVITGASDTVTIVNVVLLPSQSNTKISIQGHNRIGSMIGFFKNSSLCNAFLGSLPNGNILDPTIRIKGNSWVGGLVGIISLARNVWNVNLNKEYPTTPLQNLVLAVRFIKINRSGDYIGGLAGLISSATSQDSFLIKEYPH